MSKILPIILIALFSLNAQALFEVKDATDNTVLEVSQDGLRVFNNGDTLMVISSSEITFIIDQNTKDRALSRSFSVTTSTSAEKGGLRNVFEIGNDSTTIGTSSTIMREGINGDQYTNFSPENIFLGLNAGEVIDQGLYNIFIGNNAGQTTTIDGDPFEFQMAAYNIFIGESAGKMATYSYNNTYIGMYSGYSNTDGMNNVFLGVETGVGNTGSQNTFIGSRVCANGYSGGGSYNAFVGYEAGLEIQSGAYNTFIGRQAGKSNVSGSRNIFIGNQSGYSETGSDKLYIDNSSVTTPLIYGDFVNNALTINGTLTTTGNSTVSGTSFKISTDPGTGITPTNYVYQGGMVGSTSKQYAFAINDALWVSSHAWIDGNLTVAGTTSKSADEIRIDHPLDPENKNLSHSNVISDERMSVYSGNVVLDTDGTAIVNLPDWFEPLNTEFRYQLTPIGGAAPSLHIAKEISNMMFVIAGGKQDMKISWMITGIRNDKYAKENPLKIETMKNVSNKQIEEE